MQVKTTVTVGAVVFADGRVLLLQRSADDPVMPGLWELPSGKRDAFEQVPVALKRETREETGLHVRIVCWLTPFMYTLPEGDDGMRDTVQINALVAPEAEAGVVLSDEHQAYAWVLLAELDQYAVSAETRGVILEAKALAE